MRNNVPDGDSSAPVPPAGVEERAGGPAGRVLIEQLRASIRTLEQVPVSLAIPPAPGAASSRPACSLTPSAHGKIESPVAEGPTTSPNATSPLAALQQGGLHEIKPHAYRDTPASLGFALSVIAQLQAQAKTPEAQAKTPGAQAKTPGAQAKPPGLVLWCLTKAAAREWGRPYGPGFLRAGLDPSRFLIVETRTDKDAAWALEEGLKSGALIASLAQTDIKTHLAARRLGLAAQGARTPCFLLSGHGSAGVPGTLTRWRIATEGSAHVPFDTGAPGAACWHLSLERCRGGMAHAQAAPRAGAQTQAKPMPADGARFHVEAGDEPDGLRVAAASSHRAAKAGTAEAGEPAYGPHGATG